MAGIRFFLLPPAPNRREPRHKKPFAASYLVGADQAAIKYKDPSGIFMSYYAKRDGMSVGDKVKIVIFKEK